MRRDIVFVHIPKTAGTSLRGALKEACPDAVHLYDYGAPEPLTSPLIRELRYNGTPALQHLRSRVDCKRRLLVMGHFDVDTYSEHFAAENFVTFVREPVSRVISDYKHFVRHYSFQGSLLDFARVPHQRNKQAEYIGPIDIRTFGFIGISEHFPAEVSRLSSFLNVVLSPSVVNAAPSDQHLDVSADDREEILRLNSQDMALYRHALDCWSGFAPPKFVKGPVTGNVSLLPDGNVIGWAVGERGRRIITFELLYRDKFLDFIPCDIYRPDLVAQGISQTGMGGFYIDPSRYNVGTGELVLRHPALELRVSLPRTP